MRSTFVDLRNADQNARLKALIPRTDVNVENCCVGTLHRLGFGAEEPASVRPGIIYLSVNAASAAGLLAGPHCAAARRRVAAVMSASV